MSNSGQNYLQMHLKIARYISVHIMQNRLQGIMLPLCNLWRWLPTGDLNGAFKAVHPSRQHKYPCKLVANLVRSTVFRTNTGCMLRVTFKVWLRVWLRVYSLLISAMVMKQHTCVGTFLIFPGEKSRINTVRIDWVVEERQEVAGLKTKTVQARFSIKWWWPNYTLRANSIVLAWLIDWLKNLPMYCMFGQGATYSLEGTG